MKESLHIVISSDENYIIHGAVLCRSIIRHNKEEYKIHLHLLSNGVSEKSIAKLNSLFECEESLLSVYDMENIQSKLVVKVPPTISITAYLRLFVASILPNEIQKVIYMDVDAVVNSSLHDLWNIEFKDELIAGVLDTVTVNAKSLIGITDTEPYLNSGLLLINLKAWRAENTEGKFLSFLIKNDGNVYHHDQGILNAVCSNRKIIIHPKFNVMTSFFDFSVKQIQSLYSIVPYYTQLKIDEAKVNPVYIHFTPSISNRPWSVNCAHPLKDLYLMNKSETPWKSSYLQPDNRKLQLKFLALVHKKLPFNIYKFIITTRESLYFKKAPFLRKLLNVK